MRKLCIVIVASFMMGLLLSGCQSEKMENIPNGFLASSDTALKVARVYLEPIYGYERIKRQEPFYAIIKNNLWIIQGTVPEGGIVQPIKIILERSSGRVVSVSPVVDFSKPQRPTL
ncbi:MAG: NTF2 fold immunity protein [Victivallaceae bacterium]|nr:NTF2 fold immunity protein [Victivallaceae bacterium]